MRTDFHISVEAARVRDREIARHVVRELDGSRGFLITSGVGAPRGWSFTHEPLGDGFVRGLTENAQIPARPRLRNAFSAARDELAERCNALIERRVPDAAALALYFDGGDAHVIAAGNTRAYLWRHGEHRRLTSEQRGGVNGGILREEAGHSEIAVEPRDVILLGTGSAFSEKSVEKLSSVLHADPETSVGILATLMTEPARELGTGAAAVALRIR